MSSTAAYFDELYKGSDDPWKLRQGWYEHRKRSLTLALLPRPRYRNAFEPGCANGELTAELATRCDGLLAVDLHETAVRLARERVAGMRQVRVEQCTVPHEWPTATAPFDLIVISEFAYYLDAADLETLAARIAGSLTPDGTLLACHWRRPFTEALENADTAHALFDARCGLTRLAHHDEADLLIDVWSRDARSVAQREGLL
ncbi:class I SAM-dependent methyltransferase [Paraburkholderia nemoris]|uniref:SAM-dependent methyltransferase n=1 Tax=Paraburkholderia nemoris TaxID=2793076 RepID=A0ABM8SWQ4_9BURK|nr:MULTISPECIES: class I SAM-dependent methyltransferase [Paraburkholderia]KPD16525.1 methyltransferase [Burkholderia sp. ST111]MBK5151134.1 methyltransferase domain-containing protein [Burkholderia sp. R-69608]MBK3744122.1 methyltransferase domain-containing protein [Paraburkholderia aspalathi]MBK3785141.1 methyltransferase domain-containing protein [Paraburkholderia aspalathi]MBK3815145.1 methyltransferase domain-containing protein [Paraburkholderia aspalathi]